MGQALERAKRVSAAAATAAGLCGLGYIATTWYRYGRPKRTGAMDVALDRFMPAYEVAERHETRIHAPASVTWEAARALDLHGSPVIRAIFAGRELALRSTPAPRRPSETFLQEVLDLGWGILAEEPGRELILGAVTKPWEPDVRFRRLAPDAFAAFQEPGYAKIVWTLVVDPIGSDQSVFRTETRVATTDPESRRRFRRYWSVFFPGIRVIRWEALRLVRQAAERRVTPS
ncbi:MAG TPA: hypothetical protein VFI77_00485 [Gemmatimonadales bacterium]|nr:hypothetical protein [Gemmatimonadales bacterium]